MDYEQLLQAISEMLDTKLDERFQPVNKQFDRIDARFTRVDEQFEKVSNRLDMLEVMQKRTAKKLDDLQLDVKISEREIRRDIHDLQDEMETVIEIIKMNGLIPQKKYKTTS